jgi:uncharacterized protein YggE
MRHPALLGLAVWLAAGCAAVPGTAARPPQADVITVRGVGRVSARPDAALAQVGAEARAAGLTDATAEVARRMAAVRERVRALGVGEPDIGTVAYAVEPLVAPRRGEDDPARILGYRALNVVQVRVRDLAALGRVLDAAVAAGANVLRGISFTVLDRGRLESEARARAVSDAFERAQQLAAAAGVRLGDLLSLTEGAAAFPPAERFDRAALTAAPGPVEPGELEVVVSVEARYRLAR